MGGFLGSFGQSAGGFLSGLGDKFGDFMHGTTPVLAMHEGASIPGGDGSVPLPMQGSGGSGFETQGVPQTGTIQQAPTFTPTGQTTGGLLSKLQDPDSRGLTFGDKLFAAGSVLQGDSGGAATYLQNQRALAGKEDDKMTATRARLAGQKAFKNNIGPNGEMNFQGYANDMGDNFDPAEALALRKAMQRPAYQSVNTANGGTATFDPVSGNYRPGIAGVAKPSLFNPDGTLNENFILGRTKDVEAEAAARRRGAPLAPRAGPKPAAPQPRETGVRY
jgi:hypothetical protein